MPPDTLFELGPMRNYKAFHNSLLRLSASKYDTNLPISSPSQIPSNIRKKRLQHRVHLSRESVDRILVRAERDTKHGMRVAIAIHEDTDA